MRPTVAHNRAVTHDHHLPLVSLDETLWMGELVAETILILIWWVLLILAGEEVLPLL